LDIARKRRGKFPGSFQALLKDPAHIIIGAVRERLSVKVPAIPIDCRIFGLKNELPPPVEYLEVNFCNETGLGGGKQIIGTVFVWGKCIGQLVGRAVIYAQGVGSRAFVAQEIKCGDGITTSQACLWAMLEGPVAHSVNSRDGSWFFSGAGRVIYPVSGDIAARGAFDGRVGPGKGI